MQFNFIQKIIEFTTLLIEISTICSVLTLAEQRKQQHSSGKLTTKIVTFETKLAAYRKFMAIVPCDLV